MGDITHAIHRAMHLYAQPEAMSRIRKQIMQIDHSWENSVEAYDQVYPKKV